MLGCGGSRDCLGGSGCVYWYFGVFGGCSFNCC